MPLKRYSKKEPQVFLWVMLPYITFMNLLVFGTCIFSSVALFFKSLFFSGIYLLIVYMVFGLVAIVIQKRFPSPGDMLKRIRILLPLFYVMNVIAVSWLFYLYNYFQVLDCTPIQSMLLWAIIYGCVMSTIITFINEGVANFEGWQASVTETEKLKIAYQRSKVLGLKGQINPHFLFNCFNTLSGLIQEDNTRAEMFLDEMTKVHRYLLRSDDELLVPLENEIKFAESYMYLAKERFGGAIKIMINIDDKALQKKIPPFSMQAILENIIYTNGLSKDNPLTITITSEENDKLSVVNSIHSRIVVQDFNIEEGLNNLLSKYDMLNAGAISIHQDDNERTLLIPLFDNEEEPT
jgi:sensor histidine kinase YesM